MSPEKWQKIKEIFNQAAEMAVLERQDFLADACGTDAEMYQEIEKMLSFVEDENDLLEENAFQYLSGEKENTLPEKIGNYKIIREIGRGGMGVVYEAIRETKDFKQKVALKVIKRGMDTDAILRRFRHEQQILASLVHPNIARFLDGGMTADGLPFYAMEFVEGREIDDFCRERNLGINERLELFQQVCSAIQFAHKNFVIHRDLKPSNILIMGDGSAKLLDFGIAKILTDKADGAIGTATALGMMTPAYASPEQVRGERVNTATDIYSLGIILCELLTERKPYKLNSNSQIDLIKAICESEPLKPSSLATANYKELETDKFSNKTKSDINSKSKIQNPKSLRGDLDNIVLKSLRKEPENRYSSVEQFSEDINRYLQGLPIIARPSTFNYRTTKFIKRNLVAVTAAAFVFLSLCTGISIAVWQAVKAEKQRVLAEKRFLEVREIANNVVYKYTDAITNLPNSSGVREMLLQDAGKYLDKLAQDAKNDVPLQRELAAAYVKLADLQGSPYGGSIGDVEKAVATMRKAVEIEESILTTNPDDLEIKKNITSTYIKFGNLIYVQGDAEETRRTYQKAEDILKKLLNGEPENSDLLVKLARLQIQMGSFAAESKLDMQTARFYQQQATETVQKLLAVKEDNISQSLASSVNMRFGMLLGHPESSELGDLDAAFSKFQSALEIRRNLIEKDPENLNHQRQYATALIYQADILREQGKIKEAIAAYEEGYKKASELAARDSNDFFSRAGVTLALANWGKTLVLDNQASSGIKKMREAMIQHEQFLVEKKFDISIKNGFIIHLLNLGEALRGEKQFAEAEKCFRRALEIQNEQKHETKGFQVLEINEPAIYVALGALQFEKSENSLTNREKLLSESKINLEKGLSKFRELKSRNVLFRRFVDLDERGEKIFAKLQN